MEWGPRGEVRAAVLLIRAAVLAAIMVHRLKHVPAAAMCGGTALIAHSTAATAASRERATAAKLQIEL